MRRKNLGFTLIEALVVVTIIGILAALTVPAFTKMLERNRLKGAAEVVFNELQLARTESVKRNRDVELRFNTASPTTNWCFGTKEMDGTPCDCTVTNAAAANACQLDGVLKVARSTDYPGVTLDASSRPLYDRLVVKRLEEEDKTSSGIIIPDSAKEKPAEGEIVAVGEGARKDSGELIAPSVKAGDRILFGKWSGTEVTLNGEELLIMKESDILGIIS